MILLISEKQIEDIRKKAEEIYERYSLQFDHHTAKSIEFIDVYQLNKFNATKMGVVSETVKKFNEKFKGLAEIDFECISEYISLDYDNKKAKENKILIESELKNRNLCIVDGIGDNDSQDL